MAATKRYRSINIIDDEEKYNKKKKMKTLYRDFNYLLHSTPLPPGKNLVPEELMVDNVLTRLPAWALVRCGYVSKLWCNSIFNDTKFAARHFALQENKNLVFNLLNVDIDGGKGVCIFNLQDNYKGRDYDDSVFIDIRLLMGINFSKATELVGYCNGLACLRTGGDKGCGGMDVLNPVRGEALVLNYLIPRTGTEYLCHGFGFDSLSKEYKVVIIYTTRRMNTLNFQEEEEQVFVCMIITLGTNSWRTKVTRNSDISPPPGSSPFPKRMVTKAWKKDQRSATLCGGDLFWRITNYKHGIIINDTGVGNINGDPNDMGGGGDYINGVPNGGGNINGVPNDNNNEIEEMLLSFDIHNEKIQFIRLPTRQTTTMSTDRHHITLDHHLLEFKGYPCVARSEKILVNNKYHHHRRRNCDTDKGNFCCCIFKVHLYILEDKVKQVWVKESRFMITLKKEALLPPPYSSFFEATTTTTPPTRILGLSDNVLVYWFDGDCLIYWNPRMSHIKVVKGSLSCSKKIQDIFESKKKGISAGRGIGEDDNIQCPYMDYQLHAQVENILSLKSFIPQGGVTSVYEGTGEFQEYLKSNTGKSPAGWLKIPEIPGPGQDFEMLFDFLDMTYTYPRLLVGWGWCLKKGWIAQLVEQGTKSPRVTSSNLDLDILLKSFSRLFTEVKVDQDCLSDTALLYLNLQARHI
ncbi:hypothetical protein C5167_019567 [Papaver somniferum]|uniref:Uncharacterized protein n=1 Tax=Papaver somniferum TaxID=3469 RepID=A0A4Y7IUN3_PAPSO|nr:hypothetical protein C5167_019567 [Papaver somniferum]